MNEYLVEDLLIYIYQSLRVNKPSEDIDIDNSRKIAESESKYDLFSINIPCLSKGNRVSAGRLSDIDLIENDDDEVP